MRTRETHINIRTTTQEKARFQRNAKKCGLPLSEYLRKLANGYEPKAAPPLEYLELIRLLTNIYSDFRDPGENAYADLLANVLLEMQTAITPARRPQLENEQNPRINNCGLSDNGDDKDLAGS